jgi:HSP20 family molecular chaperone IbpA
VIGAARTNAEVVASTVATAQTMRPQTVPVNVFEAPGAMVIVAPLPAVRAGDVTISVHDNLLHFYATLRTAAPREYLVREWEYGGYEREITLPEGFGQGLEANLANGQLVIRVLRGESAYPMTVHPSAL